MLVLCFYLFFSIRSMLFSLETEYIYSVTIPAKVQTYLACGKPILAMIDGEASAIIEDAKGLVKNILELSSLKKQS